jgi:plastocyanin
MQIRWGVIGVGLVLALTVPATLPVRAQGTRKVIAISAMSWKFTPDLFTVNQGDTVVIQFSNDDPDKRNHSFAARWLLDKAVAVRGDVAREGTDDGRRFFAAAPGQRLEFEFVASETGSFPFVCGVFDHGARGQVGAMNVLRAGK